MGCITSTPRESSDLESSGPLHFDKSLAETGSTAPYLDKLAYTLTAFVVSVYDGDTFTIATHHHVPGLHGTSKDTIVRVKCRMGGIDTPEMKPPKIQPDRDQEIIKAKEAKKFVETIILNKHVKLHVDGLDKYGRWLVRAACPDTGTDLGEMLLAKGHAYQYDGGTKKAFSEYSKI
jgi:endonuclease YncB( thermonuclease family)